MAAPAQPSSHEGLVAFEWTTVDTTTWATRASIVLALGAAGLAIFGLPPIDLHGPLHYMGVMDPLCGMTRAGRSVALLHFNAAWKYNPGSFLLGAAVGSSLLRGVIGAATGRWFRLTFSRRRPIVLAAALFIVLLWINQQLHASILMKVG
jgi:hypothetical protein